MPIAQKYLADFEPEMTYHVYNRANGKEQLFRNHEDYLIFLQKFKFYLSPFLDVYCHILIPNHFHFLVKLKSEEVIKLHLNNLLHKAPFERKYLEGLISYEQLMELEFKRFFISYSMGFNRRYGRKGSLLCRQFRRLKIESDSYFTQVVVYIHANAVKHNLVSDFTTYPWSSWSELMKDNCTGLLKDDLIKWFGSMEKLIQIHFDMVEYYYSSEVSIEDD